MGVLPLTVVGWTLTMTIVGWLFGDFSVTDAIVLFLIGLIAAGFVLLLTISIRNLTN